MDLDRIERELGSLVADFYLEKDISKYLPMIYENLNIIDQFLTDNINDPESELARHLMTLGYWFYKIRDKGMQ